MHYNISKGRFSGRDVKSHIFPHPPFRQTRKSKCGIETRPGRQSRDGVMISRAKRAISMGPRTTASRSNRPSTADRCTRIL